MPYICVAHTPCGLTDICLSYGKKLFGGFHAVFVQMAVNRTAVDLLEAAFKFGDAHAYPSGQSIKSGRGFQVAFQDSCGLGNSIQVFACQTRGGCVPRLQEVVHAQGDEFQAFGLDK